MQNKITRQQTGSPKSDLTEGNITDNSRSTDVDPDESMDDLLTAINIEPPLLRDIDATVKSEWDSPLKEVVSILQIKYSTINLNPLCGFSGKPSCRKV